jgi:tetratricopeptide (TPR) repeat protein
LAEAHHDLGDDEQARAYLKKAFEVDPNVSGTVRISRALGLLPVGSPTRRQRSPINRSKWTRPEQIPSLTQIHEWVEEGNWDSILAFANPNDYSSRTLPQARDLLHLIAVSLGDCNDTKAAQALTILLHFDYYFDVTQAAVTSLSKIGDESTVALLEELSTRFDDGRYPKSLSNQAHLKASISYLRARASNPCSLSSNNGSPNLFVQAEQEYAKGNYGQARFLLEKILADMADSQPSYVDATVLLARSCAKVNDTKSAVKVIKPILGKLPETSRSQILSDVTHWLSYLIFGGYLPIHDDCFRLALNIELELALSANTPDELLRPLRELTRWLETLGARVQLLRQSIRTEAPGTWYVDKDDRERYLCNVALSEDMRRFLAAFDVRIKWEALARLKQMLRSRYLIESAAPAIGVPLPEVSTGSLAEAQTDPLSGSQSNQA